MAVLWYDLFSFRNRIVLMRKTLVLGQFWPSERSKKEEERIEMTKIINTFALACVLGVIACGGDIEQNVTLDATCGVAGEGSDRDSDPVATTPSVGGASATVVPSAGGAVANGGEASVAGQTSEPEEGVGGATIVVGVGGASLGVGGSEEVAGATGVGGATEVGGETGVAGATGVGGETGIGGSVGEGGTTGVGGSTTVACEPELRVEYLTHTSETVRPGADDVSTLTVRLTATCETMNVERLDLHVSAVDDTSYSELYYRRNGIENFADIKLVDDASGTVVAGPEYARLYTANEPAHVTFSDPFTLLADTPRTLTVKLDVSEDFRAPTLMTKYTMMFNGIVGSLNVPITTRYADDFPFVSQPDQTWPSFVVDVPAPVLVASLTASTPASQIVTPGMDPVVVSEYVVRNEGALAGEIDWIILEQSLETGSLNDCSRVDLMVDGVACGGVDPATSEVIYPECPTEIQPTGGRVLHLLCTPADPAVGATDHPMSGDVFSVGIWQIVSETVVGRVEEGEPSAMVLRKSAPVLSTVSLPTGDLVNGDIDLFSFKVTPIDGPVALKGLTLRVDTTGDVIVQNFRLRKGTEDMADVSLATPGAAWGTGNRIGGEINSARLLVSFTGEEIFGATDVEVVYTVHADAINVGSGSTVSSHFSIEEIDQETVVTGSISQKPPFYIGIGDSSDPQYLTWSDLSSLDHSPVLGESSSDWTNGLLVRYETAVYVLEYRE